ncbi:MAG: hypothetical protein K8S99_09425 [Planctomycetes bacterium]|nr:hypothetical protein [Planctomycetota bacterium]
MTLSSKKMVGLALTAALCGLSQSNTTKAVTYGGIQFSDGAISFADVVLSANQLYQGGQAATASHFLNPQNALGIPDFLADKKTGGDGAYSLGGGGMLTVGFTNNLLTNSGSSDLDLWVFEIGNMVEDTAVSIHPNSATLAILTADGVIVAPDGYVPIGQIGGGARGLDLDAYFPGFEPGVLGFNAVKLVDARSVNGVSVGILAGSGLAYAGADVDAIGAIFTKVNPGGAADSLFFTRALAQDAVPNPEPATAALAFMGLSAMALKFGRRNSQA